MRNLFPAASFAFASLVMTSGIVLASAPAHASVVAGVPTATVQTDDLDLGSAAGRATAERRIRSAADEVCANQPFVLGAEQRCRADAIQGAMRTLQTHIASR